MIEEECDEVKVEVVTGVRETDVAVVVIEILLEGVESVAFSDEIDGAVEFIEEIVEGETVAVVAEVTLDVATMINFYSTQ